jgi:hypothetical protein
MSASAASAGQDPESAVKSVMSGDESTWSEQVFSALEILAELEPEFDAEVCDAGLSPSSAVASTTLSGLDRLPGSEAAEEDVSPVCRPQSLYIGVMLDGLGKQLVF